MFTVYTYEHTFMKNKCLNEIYSKLTLGVLDVICLCF